MRLRCCLISALFIASAADVWAQTFSLQVTRDKSVYEVSSGATVDLRAPAVGTTSQVSVSAVYMGSQSVTIQRTDLQGPDDFTVQTSAPGVLKPGDRYTFSVRYNATASSFEQALLTVTYIEATQNPAPASFRLSFTGSAPEIAISYSLPADRTFRPVSNNGRIDLPPVTPASSVQATVAITNIGSGPALVRSADISALPFEIADRPLLPATVAAGQSLTFTIRAAPAAAGSYSATLQIDLPGGLFSCSVTVNSASTKPAYLLISGDTTTAISPGAAVSFPDTLVKTKSQLSIRVTNPAAAQISISDVALAGASDFQLTMPQLPLTLSPGDSRDLFLTFAPSLAQASTATLKIGADTFALTGNGLSSALGFAYTSPDGEVAIDPNGTVTLAAAAVGTSRSADFVVRNRTGQAIRIGQPGIAATGSPFRVISSLSFPFALGPQQELRFQLQFAPQTAGVLTTPLVLDSYLFTLRGVGMPPSALPKVSLSGPSGLVGALQQTSVSVSLDEPYAVDLTGTLALAFDSSIVAADPALQFAAGGRTVTFKIPAGSLSAQFPNGSDRSGLQTGSVAGKIRLSATVQTTANLDLTAPIPPAMELQIVDAVPSILAGGVVGTSGAYQIQIVGMSTSRGLKQVELQFTPSGALNLNATSFTVDVSAAAASWFRDSASLQYGGLFTLSLPLQITLPSDSNGLTLADIIGSIGVKASNGLGSSNAFIIKLR